VADDHSPEVVFEGRVIRVERERVTLANGHSTVIEAVRHRGSVVIVPRPAPDRLILIRQFRPVIQRWLWELPAGSLDPGETPDTAVVRECEEEIGLTPKRVTPLGSWYPTPGFCDEVMHFYLCEELATPEGPIARDEDEQIEPATVSVEDVRAMIADGRVVDMKTVVGLALLDARRPLR
jgi:ADP-ribose pyrophosphatase